MRLLLTVAALAVLGPLAGWILYGQNETSPVTEIQMTAKKYEFDPNTIRVHAGDHVKLVITATDHAHGLKIEALHISQKVDKGETATVEFTADKPGTYMFECSKYCGLGHGKMKGQLIVE